MVFSILFVMAFNPLENIQVGECHSWRKSKSEVGILVVMAEILAMAKFSGEFLGFFRTLWEFFVRQS